MKTPTTLILACLTCVSLSAAEIAIKSDAASPKAATERVMMSLSHDRTDETFAELFKPFWSFTGEAAPGGEKLASDLRKAASQMESTIGRRLPGKYELLGTRRLGNTYLTFVHVLNYQYGGLLVEFMFYNAGRGWFLHNVTWTPNPADDRVLWIAAPNPLPPQFQPIKQATENVMKSLFSGLTNNAVADLWKTYGIPGLDPVMQAESLASFMKSKKGVVESTFGKALPGRYEFLGARRLGSSYATLVYVHKYEYGAFPVSFLFYQTQGKWFLNNTSMADSAQMDLISVTVNEPVTPKSEP